MATAEIIANGHGDENSDNAEIIAISESWAEHVALTFADMNYGDDNSLGGIDFNYADYLEDVRNEELNHIPIGLYNDLIDGQMGENGCDDPPWAEDAECGFIDDQVQGFSNSQIFSLLNSSINSPLSFISQLNFEYLSSTANSEQDVLDLFNSY